MLAGSLEVVDEAPREVPAEPRLDDASASEESFVVDWQLPAIAVGRRSIQDRGRWQAGAA